MKGEKNKTVSTGRAHPTTTDMLRALSSRGISFKRSVIRLVKGLSAACLCLVAVVESPAQNEILSFKAQFTGTKSKLYWTTSPELHINYFAIERSWNGVDFETVGLVRPHSMGSNFGTYSFTDKDYFTSIVYYRLRLVDEKLQSTIAGNLVGIQLSEDAKEFIIKSLPGLPGSVYLDVARLDGDEIIVDAVDGEKQIVANAILSRSDFKTAFEMKPFRSLRPGGYTVSAFFDSRVIKTRLVIKEQAAPSADWTPGWTGMNFSRK